MSEVFAHVTADGERYDVSRDNISVYRHLGKAALFDHCFVSIGEDKGIYVWSHHEGYEELATLAVKNHCILHLNLPEVSEVDLNAYTKFALEDENDTPDWLPSI